MKPRIATSVVALTLFLSISPTFAGDSNTPCRDEQSNAEIRECYSKAQLRITSDADKLAKDIAADFQKQADDTELSKSVSDLLRRQQVG